MASPRALLPTFLCAACILANRTTASPVFAPNPPTVESWAARSASGGTSITLLLPAKTPSATSWALLRLPNLQPYSSGSLQLTTLLTNLELAPLSENEELAVMLTASNKNCALFKTISMMPAQSPISAWVVSLLSTALGAILAFGGVLIHNKLNRDNEANKQTREAAWIVRLLSDNLQHELEQKRYPAIPQWLTDPSIVGWRHEFARPPMASLIKDLADRAHTARNPQNRTNQRRGARHACISIKLFRHPH